VLAQVGALGAVLWARPGAVLAQARDGLELPRIDDLRALAAQSRRERIPLLFFFSTPGCPYCAQARRDYLGPLHQRGAAAGVLIREVEITSTRAFADLEGRPLSESALADRFNVKMVPHVVLVDADLNSLGKPLVGIDAAGFYGDYLKDAIDAATRRIAARARR